jgi:acetyl-CoA acetyltransferase
MENPVILSAVRTPVGKFMGGLAPLTATELGAKAISEAVRRAEIDGIGDRACETAPPCCDARMSQCCDSLRDVTGAFPYRR